MQILASALPGFRDLRAPLIAGYLWLFLLWILFGSKLASSPPDGLIASAVDLAASVGPIGAGVAVSVAAYLLGSISQILSPAVRYITRKVVVVAAYFFWGLPFITYLRYRYMVLPHYYHKHRLDRWIQIQMPSSPIDGTGRDFASGMATRLLGQLPDSNDNPTLTGLLSDGSARLYDYRQSSGAEIEKQNARLHAHYSTAVSQLESELSLPTTLLVGEDSPGLFSEADRLKAEGELRLTVIPPIVALIIAAAASYGTLWLFLILPLFILTTQGVEREQRSRQLIDNAISQKKISPRSVEDFRSYVESDRLLEDR